ncbi:MAG: DUF72 domain-containing protein [Armatimonadota bacterium]
MIHVGTSGFSYDDWVGPFYPDSLPKRDRLRYYARRFGCVEVNFTYYRMPNARTLSAMAAKTGDDFRFVIKANSTMTHERDAGPETFREFVTALEPLIDAGKFGCILAQFPHSFKPDAQNADYIKRFREQIPELPVVVEFRNRRWVCQGTFDLLRELDLGFCCVDEPQLPGLMPRIAVATSGVGYVRFHGRNARMWWQHEHAWQRYDYLYREEELREWAAKTRKLAQHTSETYVFFNNHYQAQAVANASLFEQLLEEDDR